jgi:hypothetical protein
MLVYDSVEDLSHLTGLSRTANEVQDLPLHPDLNDRVTATEALSHDVVRSSRSLRYYDDGHDEGATMMLVTMRRRTISFHMTLIDRHHHTRTACCANQREGRGRDK